MPGLPVNRPHISKQETRWDMFHHKIVADGRRAFWAIFLSSSVAFAFYNMNLKFKSSNTLA